MVCSAVAFILAEASIPFALVIPAQAGIHGKREAMVGIVRAGRRPMPSTRDRFTVLALGGDGIGPEVVNAGLEVLQAAADAAGLRIEVEQDLLHGAAWERYGTFCRDETVARARVVDAVLVGAVGDPRYDEYLAGDAFRIEDAGTDVPASRNPVDKDGLMRLRRELDVYAGLRPARVFDALVERTPYRPERVGGADLMMVRELCGGAYFGLPRGIERLPGGGRRAFDATVYTEAEIKRVARTGFELARRRRKRLLSVDKANVMESGMLWREVVSMFGARDYPDVELTHFYADNAAYQLARAPCDFDVVLADNLLGDLLSDQAGALAGSLGMLPSASLAGLPPDGEQAKPGIYEPVHGSAPDIAGRGIANPYGTILSVAMMFEYGFALPAIARRIESAVETSLRTGPRTPDIGGDAGTAEVTNAVILACRAAR